jgi:hypothetical protein
LVSWLHPWQGVTIVLLTIGLLVWSRGRQAAAMLTGIAAAGLPLAGYLALSHFDASWHSANGAGHVTRASFLVLLAALGPLGIVAIAGIRQPRGDLQERALLLWPVAILLQYYRIAPASSAAHALEGIAIPLSVLAARATERSFSIRLSPGLSNRLASIRRVSGRDFALCAIVMGLSVPGVVHLARTLLPAIGNGSGGQTVGASDWAALRFLAALPGDGGVLAPQPLGAEVPGFTGKPTWVGHPLWTPGYGERGRLAAEVAAAKLPPPVVRWEVARSGAKYVLTGCGSPSLRSVLAPLVRDVRRFGCATLYVVR